MGDLPKSPRPNFHNILGVPKSASLADIGKAYKSLVLKWHPDRNPSNKDEAEAKFSSINEAYRALSIKKREEANTCNGGDHEPKTPNKKKSSNNHKNDDQKLQISSPTLLSRTTSRISPSQSPTFSKSTSRRSTTPTRMDFYSPSTPTEPVGLSKVGSRRSTTPIFFSQSAARRKPQPIEKKLECTLEQLCVGCVKKIKITRDVISSSGYAKSLVFITFLLES